MYPPNPLPNLPTKVSISPINADLALGDTLQLTATLGDASGNACTPIQPFQFQSSNPALVSVDSTGLCTASTADPTVLATGGQVKIQVQYLFAGSTLPGAGKISAEAVIVVTVPSVISAYVPVTPGLTLSQAMQGAGSSPDGTSGSKNYPASLLD